MTTTDCPAPAKRPANSRLSTIKLEKAFGIQAQPWQTAVDDITDELLGADVK